MAIIKNAITFGSGFNITAQGPIDSRMRVESVSDLTSVWDSDAPSYVGMVVSIADTGDLYVLVAEDATQEESWKKVGSDGSGSVAVDSYTEAESLATSENIGQLIYVKVGDEQHAAGPYVVTGAGTLAKLGTTSASGDIQSDVDTLKSDVATIKGQITELEKLDDLAANSGLEKKSDGSLSVKIDPAEGNALTVGADGLKVTETPYTGSNAISVSDHQITLVVDPADKVLTQSASGVKTNLSIQYDSGQKKINLLGKDSTVLAFVDATAFIKDGMVNNVSFDPESKKLTITFNTDAGLEPIDVDLTSLVDTYTAGNGIAISGNKVSIKKADDSEAFLTVGETGIKLSGVQTAINAAKTEVEGTVTTLGGRVTTAEGEIDTLQATVGNGESGLVKDVNDLKTAVGTDEGPGLVKDVADLKSTTSGLQGTVSGLESSIAEFKVKDVDTTGVSGISLALDSETSKVKVGSVNAATLGTAVSPNIDATKVKVGQDITDGAEEEPSTIISKDATLPEAFQTLAGKIETAIAGGITGLSGDTYIKVGGSATSKSLTLDTAAVGKAMPADGSCIKADGSTGKLDLFWDEF